MSAASSLLLNGLSQTNAQNALHNYTNVMLVNLISSYKNEIKHISDERLSEEEVLNALNNNCMDQQKQLLKLEQKFNAIEFSISSLKQRQNEEMPLKMKQLMDKKSVQTQKLQQIQSKLDSMKIKFQNRNLYFANICSLYQKAFGFCIEIPNNDIFAIKFVFDYLSHSSSASASTSSSSSTSAAAVNAQSKQFSMVIALHSETTNNEYIVTDINCIRNNNSDDGHGDGNLIASNSAMELTNLNRIRSIIKSHLQTKLNQKQITLPHFIMLVRKCFVTFL